MIKEEDMKYKYLIVYCEKDYWKDEPQKYPCKCINAKTKKQALNKFKEKFPQYKALAIF